MYINCINGKGISFVRNEVKHFAKTNMNSRYFKSIVLFMIDKLTLDAQSALRRCIELYNHNTRFFAVVQNKECLIQPLLSRFCDLYINLPIVNGVHINLHEYFRPNCQVALDGEAAAKNQIMNVLTNTLDDKECMAAAHLLYSKGVMGDDVMGFLETCGHYSVHERVLLRIYLRNVRKHIRLEEYFIYLLLYLCQIRRSTFLNNIS